uniref:Uncharacterized protein n=1 Tax=Salmo trutta TaxID=8032 RepID=A0A674CC53_SALTR
MILNRYPSGPGPRWTSEGQFRDVGERQSLCRHGDAVTIEGRRNSVALVGGEGGVWYELPHELRPPPSDFLPQKDEAMYPYQIYQLYPERHGQPLPHTLVRKNSVPELSSLYLRQIMAARASSMVPPPQQNYYQPEPPLSPRRPEDGSSLYRASQQQHHLLNRSASHYGMSGLTGGRGGFRAGPPPPPPPPPPSPTHNELSRSYLEAKMIPDFQHSVGVCRAPSPACYGVQPPLPVYTASQPLSAYHPPFYSAIYNLPLDPRVGVGQAATSLMVDPATQQHGHMDGSLQRYGSVASQRLPYDPGYDPGSAMVQQHHHPSAALNMDPKRMVDPGFLAFLRAEGLADSTISLLLQQGFDSTSMLGVMEDHDVRSIATNLGQARALSSAVFRCKQQPGESALAAQQRIRGCSNSFGHTNNLYMQGMQNMTQGMSSMAVDPHTMHQQPPTTLQTFSPRMGEFLGRRPNSAPSQHLLETTTYGAPRGTFPVSSGGYGNAVTQARPLSMYNAHTGIAMSALQHQQPTAPNTPGGMAPKTFSGSYSPMELMKRAPNMPPMSPGVVQSPLHSPQLLRKGTSNAGESGVVVAASSTSHQIQTLNNNRTAGRRTGPPVIVSTMAASPDTSNHGSLTSLSLLSSPTPLLSNSSPLLSNSSDLAIPPLLSSPVLSSPLLSSPVLSCPLLSSPVLSSPVLSCPLLSCPLLSSPLPSSPLLSSPVHSCPLLSCPLLSPPLPSCPLLSCPLLSSPLLSSPVLSSPVLSSPLPSPPVLSSPVLSSPLLSSPLLSSPLLSSPLLSSPLSPDFSLACRCSF